MDISEWLIDMIDGVLEIFKLSIKVILIVSAAIIAMILSVIVRAITIALGIILAAWGLKGLGII